MANRQRKVASTALVHETYLRLIGPAHSDCQDSRGQLFADAARAMRRMRWGKHTECVWVGQRAQGTKEMLRNDQRLRGECLLEPLVFSRQKLHYERPKPDGPAAKPLTRPGPRYALPSWPVSEENAQWHPDRKGGMMFDSQRFGFSEVAPG